MRRFLRISRNVIGVFLGIAALITILKYTTGIDLLSNLNNLDVKKAISSVTGNSETEKMVTSFVKETRDNTDKLIKKTSEAVSSLGIEEIIPEKTEPSEPPETSDDKKMTPAHVKRVVDGDTFVLDNGTKVRLIGIDTPESVASEEYLKKTGKENTEEGNSASEFTKSLLEGEDVYLEFDASKEDKYGRLLAYVFMKDGRMVQDILLENGYAQLMTIQPNVKYSNHFVDVLNNAR